MWVFNVTDVIESQVSVLNNNYYGCQGCGVIKLLINKLLHPH